MAVDYSESILKICYICIVLWEWGYRRNWTYQSKWWRPPEPLDGKGYLLWESAQYAKALLDVPLGQYHSPHRQGLLNILGLATKGDGDPCMGTVEKQGTARRRNSVLQLVNLAPVKFIAVDQGTQTRSQRTLGKEIKSWGSSERKPPCQLHSL